MTKLPAPALEREMVQYASTLFARLQTYPESGEDVWRHILRWGAMFPMTRLQMIEMARGGDIDADSVLRTLIVEMQSRGEKLPTELLAYSMEIVAQVRPHQRPGPKRKRNILRDLTIALTVAAVCDRYHLRPTRHTAMRDSLSPRHSACSDDKNLTTPLK